MFHFHRWSDWSITERGKVVDFHRNDLQTGSYLVQERYCPKCGKTQINTSSTTYLNPSPSSYRLIPETHKATPKHDTVKG